MAEIIGRDTYSGLVISRRDDGCVTMEWPDNNGPRFVLLTAGQWRSLARAMAPIIGSALARNGR